MNPLINKLTGTGVALVTPFKKNEVDFDALGKMIDFVIGNGVEYIVTLGTTGETPTLTKKEQAEIVEFTSKKINNRVPLVLGIGGNNTNEVIEHFSNFSLENITAILSSSPNYNKPSQEGIFQHYKAISDASPLPVILYNVPGRTSSNITAKTTLRLANECENIKGIKEASGNMIQCMHILKNMPEGFLFVSGDDHISLPLIACGSKGVISVVANCFPKDFCDMIRFSLKYDFSNAQKLHYKLLPAYDLLFVENNPAGVKAFLAELNLIENELRLPLVPLSAPFNQEVKDFLASVS
ncbi:MAG TPA: 4-hydroxy-tetrahydrodipicolinate synthase [Hanamia sp.]|jgi:4-hydroxy-tetrahydrodipicolinate synthase|nr:4-hydroxy-tetrahydrodipicolinate synthase [Hanamia sp.]